VREWYARVASSAGTITDEVIKLEAFHAQSGEVVFVN
jgi:hypothetical protein